MNTRKLLLLALVTCLISCDQNQRNSQSAPEKDESENASVSRLEEEHALFKTGYADSVNSGLIVNDTFPGSARREATASIGNCQVVVNYGSPGKRGRVLWNGLVSYDQVWVSGSHWATAVSFSEPVQIDDQKIPAGTYGFFTIPGRETWTLILNEHYDQHLAEEYQKDLDLVRLEVTPVVNEEVVQRLTYQIIDSGEGAGVISLSWDELEVRLPFQVLD